MGCPDDWETGGRRGSEGGREGTLRNKGPEV